MDASHFIDDIPLATARGAHYWNSFEPDKRGVQEREGYAATLAGDFASLAQLADTDEKRALLESEFARYRAGYKSRKLAQLGALSRCANWMVTGPARFPVERMQKRNATESKRLNELVEYRERALKAIARKLSPEIGPIRSGDADAVDRLKAKIAGMEAEREWMKRINAAWRSGGWEKVEALPDVPAAMITNGKRTVELGYGIPFPPFSLTNLGANIRRTEERLERLERAKAKPIVEVAGVNGIRMEDDPPGNRVRLFFPGKPDASVRDKLKSSGFRWAPSIGAWQAYRNHNTISIAQTFAGPPAPAPEPEAAEDEEPDTMPGLPDVVLAPGARVQRSDTPGLLGTLVRLHGAEGACETCVGNVPHAVVKWDDTPGEEFDEDPADLAPLEAAAA